MLTAAETPPPEGVVADLRALCGARVWLIGVAHDDRDSDSRPDPRDRRGAAQGRHVGAAPRRQPGGAAKTGAAITRDDPIDVGMDRFHPDMVQTTRPREDPARVLTGGTASVIRLCDPAELRLSLGPDDGTAAFVAELHHEGTRTSRNTVTVTATDDGRRYRETSMNGAVYSRGNLERRPR